MENVLWGVLFVAIMAIVARWSYKMLSALDRPATRPDESYPSEAAWAAHYQAMAQQAAQIRRARAERIPARQQPRPRADDAPVIAFDAGSLYDPAPHAVAAIAHHAAASFDAFNGGHSGGAGASASWDSSPSPSCAEAPSYDSGSSFDSGGGSFDSGGSCGGSD